MLLLFVWRPARRLEQVNDLLHFRVFFHANEQGYVAAP